MENNDKLIGENIKENTLQDETGEKRKKKWNLWRVVIAVIVTACVFWLIFGFLTKPDNSIPKTYDEIMEKIPNTAEKGIALDIGGAKISEDIWNFYLMRNARNYASIKGAELSEIDWTDESDEKQTALEIVKYNAINDILSNASVSLRADEWGISLNDEEKVKITELDYQKQVYGDKVYERLGIKDEKDFATLRESMILEEKISLIVGADPQKYAEGENLKKFADNRSASVITIEIPKGEDGKAQERINGLRKRIHNGEDFDKLWLEVMGEFYKKQISVNPTAPYVSMIFKNGIAQSHKEMETAALNLKIVETDYSYVIMKRVIGYTEILNKVVSETDIKINKDIIGKSTVTP